MYMYAYTGCLDFVYLIMYVLLILQRLVAISGCGHLPHEECPKALLAAMSPFINRILGVPES